MCREQQEYFVSPFRCMLANGFLLLVGASPPRIENAGNRFVITKLEFNNLVIELTPSKLPDTSALDIYMSFPEGDNEPFKSKLHFYSQALNDSRCWYFQCVVCRLGKTGSSGSSEPLFPGSWKGVQPFSVRTNFGRYVKDIG